MPVLPQDWWKLAVVVALTGAIVAITRATRSRRAPSTSRLIGFALALYAVGAAAWLTHHVVVACALYAAGIASAATAVWRTRGGEADDPPDFEDWDGELPPDDPDGELRIDWDAFERDLRVYESRRRQGASRR
jgi:hypothetical protein